MKEETADRTGRTLSKRFVAMLYLPLLVPAAIPVYLARDQDDPVVLAVLVATSVALVVGNALLLVILYRWFQRSAGS